MKWSVCFVESKRKTAMREKEEKWEPSLVWLQGLEALPSALRLPVGCEKGTATGKCCSDSW